MDARTAAVHALADVIRHGHSLSAVIPPWQEKVTPRDRAFFQELCYGVLRWYPRLNAILDQLLEKPFKAKDSDVSCLLLLGLYQLLYMRVPDHAAVSATVAVVANLKKPWAKGLANAVLRNFQRQQDMLLATVDKDDAVRFAHPQWLVAEVQHAYPDDWRRLLDANNQHPPMCLRVNRQKISRDDYQQALVKIGVEASFATYSSDGLYLPRPQDVAALPGFADGWVSVQDEAAQLAADLLGAAPGERILDVCAAPGGKAAHVLERQPDVAELVAVDIDNTRLQRVHDTLQRLRLSATVKQGDATKPEQWWDERPFDRILLDAPCSASGVIRRHPDIKLLRRGSDIPRLATLQGQILRAIWPLLKPGGRLVYVTCSILPQENVRQLEQFVDKQGDAEVEAIEVPWGMAQSIGRQIMPGENGGHNVAVNATMDGFYYACLKKANAVGQ